MIKKVRASEDNITCLNPLIYSGTVTISYYFLRILIYRYHNTYVNNLPTENTSKAGFK